MAGRVAEIAGLAVCTPCAAGRYGLPGRIQGDVGLKKDEKGRVGLRVKAIPHSTHFWVSVSKKRRGARSTTAMAVQNSEKTRTDPAISKTKFGAVGL